MKIRVYRSLTQNILQKVKVLWPIQVANEWKAFPIRVDLSMAACYFVGVSVWVSAKVWGAIFGLATLPYIFGVVQRAGVPTRLAMMAPLLLVVSPNFVIWCGAGLENSLYGFLLAFGLWRVLVRQKIQSGILFPQFYLSGVYDASRRHYVRVFGWCGDDRVCYR